MISIKITPKYKPPKANTEKKKRREFSKKALCAMVILWFIGAVFGFIVVAVQIARGDMTVSLADLLLYIGAPMTGGIVSYMLKSAAENKEKIKGGSRPQEDEII